MTQTPVDSCILIVEDAPTNIRILTEALRHKDYQIKVATNGRRAFEILAKNRPDLILLDIMMPEMDGFETCRRIKESPDWCDIPIIFLTAKSDTDDIVRGFELGAVDYLTKPFNTHELLARVNTHLAMDRLRKENERLVLEEAETARHRSVAQMVAGVAHEINTPLGVIGTAADLITQWLSEPVLKGLSEQPGGEVVLEDLRDASGLIARNVARAHKLVQDFKKVSVHQITDSKEKVDLAELVAETVHLFAVTARQSRMEVEVINNLPEQCREWTGYPGSFSQVLLNLLSNVQRYAYSDGSGGKAEITLSVGSDEGKDQTYQVVVRDFGAGIPPENLSRIFDPFFTTGRGKGGSGLGMSIVYNIVTQHLKGNIEVESTVGEGTTVTCKLPVVVSSLQGVSPPTGTHLHGMTKGPWASISDKAKNRLLSGGETSSPQDFGSPS